MTLRNGKAAGPDKIPVEAIKADMETATNMLHSLFSKIWKKEEVPAVERTYRDQAAQERRPQGLQQLPRDHVPVSARQRAQQSSIGEDERGSQPQAPRPAGWPPQK